MPSESWDRVKDSFYSSENIVFSRAPGRINLIGEHTDYNGGLVLPAAVDKYAYFGFQKREDDIIIINALDLNESIEFPLSDLAKRGIGWSNFFIANLKTLVSQGVELQGFECTFSSEIPIGGGMSSSSALECGFLTGLNELLLLKMSKWDIVNNSHRSNHEFLGLKGGIMDQFSSIFGQKDTVLKLDCTTRAFEKVNFDLGQHSLLLIDTCVSHDLLTSAYNERVEQCQSAVMSLQTQFPNIKTLSDITVEMDMLSVLFENNLVKKRAQFVIAENDRVLQFIEAIKASNFIKAGALMYQSHLGLSHEYEVSCEELDFLVDLFKNEPTVLGSRMMGGGFGGCTINLIKSRSTEDVKSKALTHYADKFGIAPKFYDVSIADGASRMFK